jgi:hypothetical protein
MPKAKKKRNRSCQQKQLNAEHRNEFLIKLRGLCNKVIGEDLFNFLPPKELKRIFFYRARPIIAVPDEGQIIPPKIIKSIQGIIDYYIKSENIAIEGTSKEISIGDLYTTGITFTTYCSKLKDRDYRNAEKVRSLVLNSGLESKKLIEQIYDKLKDDIFFFLLNLLNAYWARFYSFSLDLAHSKDGMGIQFMVKVKQYPLERKKISIDGNIRPVFRIGWTFICDQFEWLYLLPTELGITSLPEDQLIPVYIQDHAIRRIYERIDCIASHALITSIYNSLRDCITIRDRDKFIIEYRILNVKVGYLSAAMIEGVLVVRTFLFLTFNGTPEGKRLERFIGLKALDTKYLKMDKLSSFMTGKLKENEELRSVFEKADCLHLVELYDKLDQFSDVHPDHSPIEMLSRYLEKGNVEKNQPGTG